MACWREAHRELICNIKVQNFIPKYKSMLDAGKVHPNIDLPAYVPFIGRKYFEYRPRVLCYAINQNLSRHAPWSKQWVRTWQADPDLAIDRLNRAEASGNAIPIRPYAEGFIPLVALITIMRHIQKNGEKLPQFIDDVITVTNFVKFSTIQDASSASIPASWWNECRERYVKTEIRILNPDIIIAFGRKTHEHLEKAIEQSAYPGADAKLISCRFPARLPSIKSKPLSAAEKKHWHQNIEPLIQRMQFPSLSPHHKWKMDRYPNYFLEYAQSIIGN